MDQPPNFPVQNIKNCMALAQKNLYSILALKGVKARVPFLYITIVDNILLNIYFQRFYLGLKWYGVKFISGQRLS